MSFEAGYGNLPPQFTDEKESSIIMLPVPYEGTCTWGTGTARGPEAIIAASHEMELYDIETATEPYETGIFTDRPVTEAESPESMVAAVEQRVSSHLNHNKFIITLGGEHSVSIGAIDAHHKKYENMSVLQFDAHADLRDTYEGTQFNHASVMARALDKGPIMQVGIRSMDKSEMTLVKRDRIYYAHEIHRQKTDTEWIDSLIHKLTDYVYITIDLDVFDSSIIPATGTPEPGGLDWYTVTAVLKKVAETKTIVGFDCVELSPHETSQPSDFLAAKLIYKIMAYMTSQGDRYPWIKKIS